MGFFDLAYHSKNPSNLWRCQYLILQSTHLLLYIGDKRNILCKECGIKVWCYLGTHWELGNIINDYWELGEKFWNHVERNWEHQILKKSHLPPWCVGHHIWPRLMARAQIVGRCSRSQILTWGSEVGTNSWIAEPYPQDFLVELCHSICC